MGVVYPEHHYQQFDPQIVNANLQEWFAAFPLGTNATSRAAENSHVCFSGQCRLLSFTASSTLASAQWIQFFDAPTLPADGAIPFISFGIATVNSTGFSWGIYGRWMQFGLVVCNSTTQNSKTIGAANTLFDVQYNPLVY